MWGAVSDRIGTAPTLAMFGLSVPALLMCPLATSMVGADPSFAVDLFRGSAMVGALCYAGAPVMLAPAVQDIFGQENASQIYQRMWIAVPAANVVGTTLMSNARDYSYQRHAMELAQLVDEPAFVREFGCVAAEAGPLVQQKVCTIPLMMKLAPAGTVDPTPFLYNEVFYTIAGASAVAFACNVAAFRMARPRAW